jgi:hypothetical protein
MDELRKTELQQSIMLKIHRYQRRVLIAKTAGFGALCAASLSFIVLGYFNLMSSLAQSGFFQFASLFFSDFSSAAANFQDFAFSIVESFPVFSAALILGAIVATIWSAGNFIEDFSYLRSQNSILPRTS